ncbi:ATP-binding protein [Pseudaestuariivita sp.]|uniref:ATP-binding protein n=1 Tax=Pseudaestuariivita sp. TaxID=2211669 RepID=UPI004059C73E
MSEMWRKPPACQKARDAGQMSEPARDRAPWAQVFEALPLYLWEANTDQRFSFTSGGFERLNGAPAASRIGAQMLAGTQDRQFSGPRYARHNALIRSGLGFSNHTFVKSVGPRDAVLMVTAAPRFDDTGAPAGLRGVTLDLSRALELAAEEEPALAELAPPSSAVRQALGVRRAELENANRLLVEVLDGLGEGLLVTSGETLGDPQNRIEIVNPAYRELFDLSEDDIYPGQRLADYIAVLMARGDATPPEAFAEIERRLMQGETISLKVPGRDRHYLCKAVRRPSGGFILVHSDVTTLQKQNADLAAARDAAHVASEAKSRFLATMSHELRTPMNGVVGMADILHGTTLTGEQRACVDTIRASALALTDVISGLLDISGIEAGDLQVAPRPVDLAGLVSDVCRAMAPAAAAKGLAFDAHEIAPQRVMADAARLRQVLTHLIGNAVKFTESGAVRLSIQPAGAERWSFAITDTGPGIPLGLQRRIFDPFVQGETGMDRAHDGSGLGLAVSAGLVKAMGGTMRLRSAPGEGSTFTVSLPLPAAPVLSEPAPAIREQPLQGSAILVVEDNRTNQRVICGMLKRAGAEVTLAENGAEALAALDGASRFDVVLMDLSMPVLSGLDATRALRARPKDHPARKVPVVALTGNAFDSDRRACDAAGMNGFLTKPIQSAELVTALKSHVARPG